MGILKETKHHRYYVFGHIDGEHIVYSKQVDSFTFMVDDYESATLFDTEDDAIKAAGYMARTDEEGKELTYVVGRVIVDIDPMYGMKVVNRKD